MEPYGLMRCEKTAHDLTGPYIWENHGSNHQQVGYRTNTSNVHREKHSYIVSMVVKILFGNSQINDQHEEGNGLRKTPTSELF